MGFFVKALHCDGALEFVKDDIGTHLKNCSITLQQTAPYAHSQNGTAEYFIHTLQDTAQVLLANSGLPDSFLMDAITTAQYLHNHLSTCSLPPDTTPHHIYHCCKPNLS